MPAQFEKLYDRYFQKSRTFLFPAIGIPRVSFTKGIQSYITWKNRIGKNDYVLTVIYTGIRTPEFKKFEKEYLLKNPYLHLTYALQNGAFAYTYNLRDFKEDWQHFLNGKYSKISETLKNKILKFYGYQTPEGMYMTSFLYPENYFNQYAELLGVDEELLIGLGELCDPWDKEKELLIMNTKLTLSF